MTPLFFGSEPVIATAGKFKGTAILQDEQRQGLAMLRALDEEQRAKAALSRFPRPATTTWARPSRTTSSSTTPGVPASQADARPRRQQLLALVDAVRRQHGRRPRAGEDGRGARGTSTRPTSPGSAAPTPDSVFYYRIHSPVVLIEFDHQRPAVCGTCQIPNAAHREHIHAVVRTPNGNDYGKDLLRQHYLAHPHS